MTAAQALRSPQFWVLCAHLFHLLRHAFGPDLHTVSYAVLCGLPVMAAVTIYRV